MKDLVRKIIPLFLISWYHLVSAFLGAFLYGFPSKRLTVIGVTGTKGKSTVVDLTIRILEEGGFKTASLSSIKFKIGEKEWQNDLKMTMPGRFKIQKFLRQAVQEGCKYAVLEITSEGIKQHRHRFIDFDVAVLTNLAPEHIESHGSFEKYREAKGKLFQATKGTHIINLDDENAEYFLQFPSSQKFYCSIDKSLEIESLKIDWKLKIENWKFIKAVDVKLYDNGISFVVDNSQFNMKLLGGFNISNSLAAICVGLSQGISLETCKKALEKVEGIPGRMELVISEPFKVFVDYAHTPDSLEKVYEILTHQLINSSTNKLVCVLGSCGGGRDKWKRPKMGEIAARYCDEIILTNEDPYGENPLQIIEQIESGFSQILNPKSEILNHRKTLDRQEAIKEALKTARAGDVVIITGKGSEPWMCVAGGKKNPWDDREIVREQFRELKIQK